MNKSTDTRHKIGDTVTIRMHPQLSPNPYEYREPEETTVVITSADKMGNGSIRYRALSPRSVEWYE